jgi:hypothetical protein
VPLSNLPGPLDGPWRSHHQVRVTADGTPVATYSGPLSRFGQCRPDGLIESLSMLAAATVSTVIMLAYAWVHHHYGPLGHGDRVRMNYAIPAILVTSIGVITLYYRSDRWVIIFTYLACCIIAASLLVWLILDVLLF